MSLITPTTSATTNPHRRRPPAIVIALGAAIIVGLIVSAFAWPAATAKPHDLPVGILGPTEAVDAVESVLAEQDPAPLKLTAVADREAAITDIKTRQLYGAILLGDKPEILIASAAGAAPAQALRAIATQLQAQIDSKALGAVTEQLTAIMTALTSGKAPALPTGQTASGAEIPTVTVTDVAPLVESDRLGAGLSSMVLPLVLGGLLGGALISQLVSGRVRRIIAIVIFAVGAAAGVVGVMQSWLGLIGGQWLLNAGVVALGIGATTSFVVGCAALFGLAGLPLAALVTLLLANPISGAAMPPEFLPTPWGSVGQAFVPGAASTLLRSAVYFPSAATWTQWLTLSAWALGGMALLLLGRHGNSAKR
ncbi:MAG: hypothetical protein LBV06_02650 [Propionibacteriaceae bacterium]|jgi:hypothetical protein|nr:hypothetical protein [Propionibacteriaceae bacterium]